MAFFKKSTGQELAWKSGLKVSLLPLGPSCRLQTILLSDLVGCACQLQIELAVWRTFFLNLKRAKQPLQFAAGCNAQTTEQIQFFSKVRK